MSVHHLHKGLDLQIAGSPGQRVEDGATVHHVGVVTDDFPGLRPRLAVTEGDTVARGQLLFEDRNAPGVRHTAPGAGRITAINRGPRRALRSLVIELSQSERAGRPSASEVATAPSFRNKRAGELAAEEVRALMLETGLWTAFRTRPFDRVPMATARPHALFVNAMDTAPLAAAPVPIIRAAMDDFRTGLVLLSQLSPGATHVCAGINDDLSDAVGSGMTLHRFAGPHPAGTAGVHVHRICPASRDRTVWTIGYQEVIAVGVLARTGVLPTERIIALSGPSMRRPRLVHSRLGASTAELVNEEAEPDSLVISGSVLDGRAMLASDLGYLGRYHLQVCALPHTTDDQERGDQNVGGPILPLGRYERVFPFELLPTSLLRALACGDLEQAEILGCLELVPEDLALCSYVCPGGNDFGPLLRDALDHLHDDVEPDGLQAGSPDDESTEMRGPNGI